jgi:hypothetical protein
VPTKHSADEAKPESHQRFGRDTTKWQDDADQGGRPEKAWQVLEYGRIDCEHNCYRDALLVAPSSWAEQSRFCPGQPKQEFGYQKLLGGFQ